MIDDIKKIIDATKGIKEEIEREKMKMNAKIKSSWRYLNVRKPQEIRIIKAILEDDDAKVYLYQFDEDAYGGFPFLLLSDRKYAFGWNKIVYAPEERLFEILKERVDVVTYEYIYRTLSKLYKNRGVVFSLFGGVIRYEKTFSNPFLYVTKSCTNIEYYKPTNVEDIEELLKVGLYQGWEYDPMLKNLFLMQNFELDPIEDHKLQRYNPHMMLITGSKAGKSFLARTIGCEPIIFGLNFDTSRIRTPLFISWFEDLLSKKGFTKKIQLLMEKGYVRKSYGKSEVEYYYSNSIGLLSNPNIPYMIKHTYIYLIAPQLGVIYYNPDTKPARPDDSLYYILSEEEIQNAHGVILSLRELLSKKLKELINNPEIKKWLEKPFEEEFVKKIDEIKNKLPKIQRLHVFLENYKESYRHLKGGAVRLALWDKYIIYEILHDKFDLFHFKDVLLDKYNYLKKIVLSSFERITHDKRIHYRILLP